MRSKKRGRGAALRGRVLGGDSKRRMGQRGSGASGKASGTEMRSVIPPRPAPLPIGLITEEESGGVCPAPPRPLPVAPPP